MTTGMWFSPWAVHCVATAHGTITGSKFRGIVIIWSIQRSRKLASVASSVHQTGSFHPNAFSVIWSGLQSWMLCTLLSMHAAILVSLKKACFHYTPSGLHKCRTSLYMIITIDARLWRSCTGSTPSQNSSSFLHSKRWLLLHSPDPVFNHECYVLCCPCMQLYWWV
jgi:hypothetical protein